MTHRYKATARPVGATGKAKTLERYAKSEVPAPVPFAPLEEGDDTIEALIQAFEAAGQVDDDGNEYWTGRKLQSLLDYQKWDNFLAVVARARQACIQSGHNPADHFADAGKMVPLGSGAEREIEDIILSRYAAYLVAQNADPKKKGIIYLTPETPSGRYLLDMGINL